LVSTTLSGDPYKPEFRLQRIQHTDTAALFEFDIDNHQIDRCLGQAAQRLGFTLRATAEFDSVEFTQYAAEQLLQ